MSSVVIVACFVAAVWLTVFRGAGVALALVYLPALLLLSQVSQLSLPGLTDANPPTGALYGILLGGLLVLGIEKRRPRLRMTLVDWVVVSLLCSYIVSAAVVDYPYKGISVLGAMALSFGFLPYFVVRSAWKDPALLRKTLVVLVWTIVLIFPFALIEARLWPRTYLKILSLAGLAEDPTGMIVARFGFYRASSSFLHPIDLGVGAAIVFAMIAMCAWRLRLISKPWVRGGLVAAFVASVCGLSFSAYTGASVGLALYFVVVQFPRSRRPLVALVAFLIVCGFALTARLASDAWEPPAEAETTFEGSYRMRQLIVQRSIRAATTAGVLGWGGAARDQLEMRKNVADTIGTMSVDNAYLLFVLVRGWATLTIWLALPLSLALVTSRACRRGRSRRELHSMLAGFSAVIGTMVSMYTVWFGFVYAPLFMMVLALTVNAAQTNTRAPAPAQGRSTVSPGLTRPATPS